MKTIHSIHSICMRCKIERDTVQGQNPVFRPDSYTTIHFKWNCKEYTPKDENIFISLWHIPVHSFHMPSKESFSNLCALPLTYIFTLTSTTSSPLPTAFYGHTNQIKRNYLNKYTLNKQNTSHGSFFFFFLPCKAEKSPNAAKQSSSYFIQQRSLPGLASQIYQLLLPLCC